MVDSSPPERLNEAHRNDETERFSTSCPELENEAEGDPSALDSTEHPTSPDPHGDKAEDVEAPQRKPTAGFEDEDQAIHRTENPSAQTTEDAGPSGITPPLTQLRAQVNHVTPGAVRVSPREVVDFARDGRSSQSSVLSDAPTPRTHSDGAPLIEAMLVTDASVALSPTPNDRAGRSNQRWMLCGGVLLVLAVAAAVGVSMGLTRKRASDPSTVQPQATTTAAVSFLRTLPNSTLAALEDPTSPQSLALAWVTAPDQPSFAEGERVTQRFALAALCYATRGAGSDGVWYESYKWLDSISSECDWYGIKCLSASSSLVTSLDLTDNGLSGSLVPEVGLLTELQELVLRDNKLVGTLPPELAAGHMNQLTTLNLFNNSLTGSIPTEVGTMTALRELSLGVNNLAGTIPTNLGALSRIETFDLFKNALTGSIPTELGRLTNTTDFVLQYNNLNGTIPASLFRLTQVGRMLLSNNALTGPFPTKFGHLRQLSWLSVAAVPLDPSPIPTELGYLSAVFNLDIWGNGLTGPIPTELGLLSSLKYLQLEGNALTGTIPTELGQASLESLHLYYNHLTGTVPAELCRTVKGSTDLTPIEIDCQFVNCSSCEDACECK